MKSKSRLPHWLRPKTPRQALSVGVGWYIEEEWAKVKATAVDAERFEATYPEWVQMAEESLVKMHAAGLMAEKCYVQADVLLAWCLDHNKPNDAPARATFVTAQMQKAGESEG